MKNLIIEIFIKHNRPAFVPQNQIPPFTFKKTFSTRLLKDYGRQFLEKTGFTKHFQYLTFNNKKLLIMITIKLQKMMLLKTVQQQFKLFFQAL